MLALQPTSPQAMPQTAVPGLPKYSLVAPSAQVHPLIVYLSNSIKRDVRLLAAMGAIKEPGMRVMCSYLPYATTGDDEADVIAKSLSTAYAFPLASVAEYAANKPGAISFFSQSPTRDPADAKRAIAHAKKLNRQRSETAPLRPTERASSPRKEKGLGAKLGAFFNKLTLDSETSPRLRTTPSPRGKVPFPKAPSSSPLATLAEEERQGSHERSLSDSPTDEPHRVVAHRQTVSYCQQTPLGATRLVEQRKPSQNSQHSAASAKSASNSSGASTLTVNTRKRSFTHLGLSMESLPAQPQSAGPQLRRAKPTNLTTFQAKLTVPTNSLGLVLQSATKPLPMPTRAQRHHNDPKSPTRINCGLSSIVNSRYSASSPLSAKPSAFPPMPSDACQAAMLSGSQLSLAREQKDNRRSQQNTKPTPKATDMDSAIASMLVIATSTYDYSSSIKGDLEFVKGERIIVQSKVNDDWWFGSILPESGRGSTGRSGMFPRSHVSFS
ncbi:protein that induces appearance of [PIN+] prion when overproduced [Coemansia sp. S680]|nr:protein that induces appearance of [PIN+] prion when overproduced [Coemansia sp. S680]